MSHALPADVAANVLSNLLGIAGIAMYAVPILRQNTRSRLETTLLFLLLCMTGGLVCRSIAWTISGTAGDLPISQWLTRIELAFAFVVPLAFALFCESLLRKHLPLSFKSVVAVATAVFEIANLFTRVTGHSVAMHAFAAYLLVVQLWITCLFLFRDRAELTPAENVMVDSVAVALWLMVPLYLTDFKLFEHAFHVRFGVLAVLIFIYALVRGQTYQDRKRTVFTELALWAGQALAIAAGVYAIIEYRDPDLFYRLASLSLSLVLLFLIRKRVRFLELRSRDAVFLRWLASAKIGSLSDFVSSLRHLKAEEEYLVLDSRQLHGYEQESLAGLFENLKTGSLRLAQARELVRKGGPHSYAAEQLVDLLEKNGKNYACIFRSRPLLLFLVSMPQPGQEEMAELELSVLRKFGNLVESEA